MDSRILPDGFTAVYEALYVQSLDDGMGGKGKVADAGIALGRAAGKPVGQYRVSTGERTSIGRKSGPKLKKLDQTSKTLKDERAFNFRVKVDKRLRAIGREIAAFLEGQDLRLVSHRVCSGKCGKFGDAEWNFCARCGGPMRELDSDDLGG